MIILGIDPGSVRIGYGVIEKKNSRLKHVESGLIKMPPAAKDAKLVFLEKELKKIIRRTKPDLAGLEKLYFAKNRKTGMEVAQARGVIIATLVKSKLPLTEISPSTVKLATAGHGQASKEAVAKMAALSLGLTPRRQLDDITDALAVAIAASTLTVKTF